MADEITGGRLCGHVRFAYTGDVGPATYCHCEDCRKASGSAFHVGVPLDAPSFQVVSGKPKAFTKRADSGNEITRYFCPECGSPVYNLLPSRPGIVFVKASALDDPRYVRPGSEIWVGSSVPWSRIAPDLPSFDRGRR